jgi:putative tryptophan/tyrosine transport system substrate-binding protein
MPVGRTNRRTFIAALGSAAAWPLVAHGQQSTMPVIGFLAAASPDTFADPLRAFRQGLKETGYVEGENVAISYRFAENQIDRLPELADDLVRRQVAVIATVASGVFAAKAATTTIPIVFVIADDPVRLGLVTSLARPSGNVTGTNFLNAELSAKRLELLRELLPAATRIAVLATPAGSSSSSSGEQPLRGIDAAARAAGLQVQIVKVSTSQEIDAAFVTFARERPDALFVSPDPFFLGRRMQLTHLATRYAMPVAYAPRDYCEAGGLMSYGASLSDAFRQVGVYTGRILKGAKPVDLPVVQASKFELVINAQAARTLGLTVPPSLLARADEVIE